MQRLVECASALSAAVDALSFAAPITHVYNPLDYAWEPHRAYLRRFAKRGVRALLLGMNPGPWGMAQTGVPFGEVEMVRDWLGIEAPVHKPAVEHPRRPIQGFECGRSEVSGQRLWGWARARWGTPERFFADHFVYNYCPLVFMEESGRNFTPDKLPRDERSALEDVCDAALRRVVGAIQPAMVVGVGAFAERRAHAALGTAAPTIGRLLHPSPASPAANRGWAEAADRDWQRLGLAGGGVGGD